MNQCQDGWPRLPPDLLCALPVREQVMIRQHEEETIAASRMQLDDICDNCHSKPQFAKTYRVLRRDLRDTLQRLRVASSHPHPDLSDACMAAVLRSSDAILSYKLQLMAIHFFQRWGEPIDVWAGEEGSAIDRAGCVVAIAVIGSGLGGLCALLLSG